MIITIDGPSGTGKSTVAKSLAEKLHYIYFDTGAMYRAFTWMVMREKIDIHDPSALSSALEKFSFEIEEKGGEKKYFVGSHDVTLDIRSPEVTAKVSEVAAIHEIRLSLVHIQRTFAEKKDVVFEGRDMGTVVFPKAHLKIFLTANAKIRAKRRELELQNKFPEKKDEFQFDRILSEIEKRDHLDSTRKYSPLKQAEDAILIDTSDLSVHEVVAKILKVKEKKFRNRKMRPIYWFFRNLAWLYFRIFYRLRIFGEEHFPYGGAIIAGNHTSFFDPPLIGASCPEEIHFIAKEPLFRFPIFGFLIRKLNAHPVSRDASDIKTIKTICALLKKGKKVALFPEGERTFEGELGSLLPGIGFLAFRSQVSVIPIYINGAFQAWGRKKKFPKLFGKITLVIGSEISFSSVAHLEKREAGEKIVQETEAALRNLRDWYKKGCKGPPP